MKLKTLTILALGLSTATSFARPLHCEIKENGATVYTNQINSERHKRIEFGQTPSLSGYITEGDNGSFTIEAFIPNYDARVYAEGVLRVKTDKLTASLWTRQVLVDVQCLPL